MKLPTAYQGAKIGIYVMLFSICANGLAYLAGIDVPDQRNAVFGFLVLLILFIVQAVVFRPKKK